MHPIAANYKKQVARHYLDKVQNHMSSHKTPESLLPKICGVLTKWKHHKWNHCSGTEWLIEQYCWIFAMLFLPRLLQAANVRSKPL